VIRLEGDGLEGLCTEKVILDEYGWQRNKWIWNMGIGKIIPEAQRENNSHGNRVLEGATS